MDMNGMSGMFGPQNMSMMSTAMGFTSGPGTPLYSPNWIPTTTGAYAGSCIFLISLAVIFRAALAFKARLEHHWSNAEQDRRYVIRGKPELDSDRESTRARLVTQEGSTGEEVRIIRTAVSTIPPWRLSTEVPRAFLVMVIAGIGYLLMLAVMTMNVGYFLSTLAGFFVGELFAGRFSAGAGSSIH